MSKIIGKSCEKEGADHLCTTELGTEKACLNLIVFKISCHFSRSGTFWFTAANGHGTRGTAISARFHKVPCPLAAVKVSLLNRSVSSGNKDCSCGLGPSSVPIYYLAIPTYISKLFYDFGKIGGAITCGSWKESCPKRGGWGNLAILGTWRILVAQFLAEGSGSTNLRKVHL